MRPDLLTFPVFIPIALGIITFLLPRDIKRVRELVVVVATATGLISTLLLLGYSGEELRWGFSYPALEIRFDFAAPLGVRLPLVIATALETLIAVFLIFAIPTRFRTSEYCLLLLYVSGVVNGILLSEDYVEMVLFGELLFVTLYGLVALAALLSSYPVKEGAVLRTSPYDPKTSSVHRWSNSRISDLSGLRITKLVKALARLVFVGIDRGIDAVYERLITGGGDLFIGLLKDVHKGTYATYLSWVMGGFALLVSFLVLGTGFALKTFILLGSAVVLFQVVRAAMASSSIGRSIYYSGKKATPEEEGIILPKYDPVRVRSEEGKKENPAERMKRFN